MQLAIKFSTLTAREIEEMTIFSTTSDRDCDKMMTFPFSDPGPIRYGASDMRYVLNQMWSRVWCDVMFWYDLL